MGLIRTGCHVPAGGFFFIAKRKNLLARTLAQAYQPMGADLSQISRKRKAVE